MKRSTTLDLTGMVFGDYRVLRRNDPANNKKGDALWQVQCICGSAPRARTASSLRAGQARSCGHRVGEKLRAAMQKRLNKPVRSPAPPAVDEAWKDLWAAMTKPLAV